MGITGLTEILSRVGLQPKRRWYKEAYGSANWLLGPFAG
jgi:hypothetical protein